MPALRVLFTTQEDPFFIPEFFREFISFHDPRQVNVLGVIIQETFGDRSFKDLVSRMWNFYGPWDFVRVGFRYVLTKVMSFIAVRMFRGRFPGAFSLLHVFLREGWKTIHCRDINSPDFVATVRDMNADLIISVAASQKFKEPLLSTPRLGCVNIHNSLLPKNRGMMPNFWALMNIDHEPVSGMTIHRMNQSLDDGPIVLQRPMRLDRRESLHELMKRTKRLNAHLVLECLSLFQNGEPGTRLNDQSEATYNTFPGKEDVKRFREKGLRLL